METHAEYSHNNPLPYCGAHSILFQIDGYMNQQEWLPEPTAKRKPRESNDDLRRHKCKARYKAQLANGSQTVEQLSKALSIQKQSVRLKIREYIEAGWVEHCPDTKRYSWCEDENNGDNTNGY